MVFSTPPLIKVEDLPTQVSGAKPQNNAFVLPGGDLGLNEFLEAAERQMILSAYESSGGVKTETARRLKIKTSALYYKLEKYGIGTVAGRDQSDENVPADEDRPMTRNDSSRRSCNGSRPGRRPCTRRTTWRRWPAPPPRARGRRAGREDGTDRPGVHPAVGVAADLAVHGAHVQAGAAADALEDLVELTAEDV